MTDTPAPVTPRTEAGLSRRVHKRLWPDSTDADFAAMDPSSRRRLELTIKATLREAAAPATEDHYDGPREYGWHPPAATEALLRELAASGVVHEAEPPGIDYVTVQVGMDTWAELQARVALASPEPTPDSGLDVERLAAPLHDWLLVYNKDRQPYPGQCTGTHMIGMGDCQFAARAIRARLSSADPSESSA